MAYAYLAADLASGALIPPELPLTNVTWERQLNGAGQFTAQLKLPPPVNAANRRLVEAYKDATDRKRRCIYVLRDETPMGVWWIRERRYSIVDQILEIKATELTSYLDFRLFGFAAPYHLVPRAFSGSPVQVARDIIATIADDIALDLSAVDTAGNGAPDISYEGRLADGKSLGSVISDLAKAEDPLGFDYRIDLAGSGTAFTRRLVMARHVGANVGLIAKLTTPWGVGNIVDGDVLEDDRRANYVAALGQGDGDNRATGEAYTDDWGPRVSTSISVTDESDTAILNARAGAYLRLVEHISLPRISMRSDLIDAQLGTFAPGDVGVISVDAGVDPWWPDGLWDLRRVVAYRVQVPDNGDAEIVTFTFDDPASEF